MKHVTLALNVFEPSSWTEHDVEDVRDFLMTQFAVFPMNARIYHKDVALICDVTPGSEDEIEKLGELEGPFIVVVHPGNPLAIIFLVISLVALVATYFLLPNAVTAHAQNGQQAPSPNNSLSDRSNTVRLKGRIPDIYGQVRATPDLIQVPYRIFGDNGGGLIGPSTEYEISYMCISRGELTLDQIKDGDTLISLIVGESAEVYGPFTSPNSGSPVLTIGDPIATPVLTISKCNNVNGQTLYPVNYKSLMPAAHCYFQAGNSSGTQGSIFSNNNALENLPTILGPGDTVVISNAIFTVGAVTANLNGTYSCGSTSFSPNYVQLGIPVALQAEWAKVWGFAGNKTAVASPTIDGRPGGTVEVGPFVVGDKTSTGFSINVVAQQGLYSVTADGTDTEPVNATFYINLQAVDANDNPIGTIYQYGYYVLFGSSQKVQCAATYQSTFPNGIYRMAVSMVRRDTHDYSFKGELQDEIAWRDLYATGPVAQTDFGNVTTIQTKTAATQTALANKERKVNMLATRNVPVRISGNTFGANTPTTQADAIICAIALDPYIGNCDISEISVDSIYNTVASINAYFGTTLASQFSYTFDNEKITYEETVASIADTIFSLAYRRGSVLNLSFEAQESDSTILFNHRNIIPTSEQRTIRFGTQDQIDGVELNYVNPYDETSITMSVPGGTALNPKVVDSIGIRNTAQAFFKAWRIWQKLQFQNIATQFSATAESQIVMRNDRVLIADTTRADTQSGEVFTQSGLVLTLSQIFNFTTLSHTIFLQLYDGTTQAIPIKAATTGTNVITLASAPNLPLALTDDLRARTTYQIVGNNDARSSAFLIDTKTPQDNMNCDIAAINYSDLYYKYDRASFLSYQFFDSKDILALFGDTFVMATVTQNSDGSGNVANASAIALLPIVTGQTNYVSGFQINGSGATAGLPVNVTLTGVIGGTLTYTYCAVAGVLLPNQPLTVEFNPPLQASGPGVAITVTCPALGVGNTHNSANIQGFSV